MEGLLSTGPTPSSFFRKEQNIKWKMHSLSQAFFKVFVSLPSLDFVSLEATARTIMIITFVMKKHLTKIVALSFTQKPVNT